MGLVFRSFDPGCVAYEMFSICSLREEKFVIVPSARPLVDTQSSVADAVPLIYSNCRNDIMYHCGEGLRF